MFLPKTKLRIKLRIHKYFFCMWYLWKWGNNYWPGARETHFEPDNHASTNWTFGATSRHLQTGMGRQMRILWTLLKSTFIGNFVHIAQKEINTIQTGSNHPKKNIASAHRFYHYKANLKGSLLVLVLFLSLFCRRSKRSWSMATTTWTMPTGPPYQHQQKIIWKHICDKLKNKSRTMYARETNFVPNVP